MKKKNSVLDPALGHSELSCCLQHLHSMWTPVLSSSCFTSRPNVPGKSIRGWPRCCGRPRKSPWLLASPWPTLAVIAHLGSEPRIKSLSLLLFLCVCISPFLSVCNSAFQTDKINPQRALIPM